MNGIFLLAFGRYLDPRATAASGKRSRVLDSSLWHVRELVLHDAGSSLRHCGAIPNHSCGAHRTAVAGKSGDGRFLECRPCDYCVLSASPLGLAGQSVAVSTLPPSDSSAPLTGDLEARYSIPLGLGSGPGWSANKKLRALSITSGLPVTHSPYWSPRTKLSGHPASVLSPLRNGSSRFLVAGGSQIQSSTVEIDCVYEVLFIAESSSGIFHPLNLGIDRFAGSVRDGVG